ncbi:MULTISPECIES: hypothetical protein [Sphingobacterium]|uniref:Uncharacterized protein n=1 Tax=Sphingobacterium populi TaxID=1812824 RepID=A0ABW5UB70_9SPHI|nr:hypothetical protein [Sphingobacterium sp. CFCC 11742]
MKTISEEVLLQNMTDLDKLKANIYINSIQNYIDILRKNWNPQTLTVQGRTGEGLLYWDVYNLNYTIENMAFKGYVFKNISSVMENSTTIVNRKKKYTKPTILPKVVEMESTIAGSANQESEVSNGI